MIKLGDVVLFIRGDNKHLQSSLKQSEGMVQSALGSMGRVMEGAFSYAIGGMIERGIGAITDGITSLASSAVSGISSAVGVAGDFQASMNLLQATTGATDEQMRKLTDTAKQLGADMSLPATSANDAALALLELTKAGLSVNDAMAASRGVLQMSAAAGIDNARAAEIVANALNSFSLSGNEATRVSDLLAAAANASSADVTDLADALQMSSAVAAQAGIPIEDLIAMLAEMANKGIKGSDAGTSIKQMLLSLMAPTDAASKSLRSFGISIYDAAGNMLSAGDIFAQFRGKLSEGADLLSTGANKDLAKAAQKASENIEKLRGKIESERERIAILDREMAGEGRAAGGRLEGTAAARKQAQIDAARTQISILERELAGEGREGGRLEGTAAARKQAQIDAARTRISILERELAGEGSAAGGPLGGLAATKKQKQIDDARDKLAQYEKDLASAESTVNEFNQAEAMRGQVVGEVSEETRNAALSTIFGSDAVRAANIVAMGSVDAHQKMLQAITREGAAAEMAGARTKGMKGAMEGLQSTVETAMLALGEPLLGPVESAVRGVAELLGGSKMMGAIERLGSGLGQGMSDVVTKVLAMLNTPEIQGALFKMFDDVIAFMPQLSQAIVNGLSWLITQGVPALREGFTWLTTVGLPSLQTGFSWLTSTGLPMLQSGIQFVAENWAKFQAVITAVIAVIVGSQLVALISSIIGVITTLGGIFSTVIAAIGGAPAVISAVVAALGTLALPITLVVAAVVALWLAWKTNFLGIRDFTMEIIGKILDYLSGIKFPNPLDVIVNAMNWILEKASEVGSALAGLLGLSGSVPAFASGTSYAPGGLALVGERGPELMAVPQGARVYSAQETQNLLGPGTFNITINAPGGNPETVARATQDGVLRALRSRGRR